MRLYHFTSPDRVSRIKRRGLTQGMVILPPTYAPPSYRIGDRLPPQPGQPPQTEAVFGLVGQWLTDDPEWRQAWATRGSIPDDRTAWRVEVDVPATELLVRLLKWPVFVTLRRIDQRWPLWLADFEGRTLGEDGAAYGRRPDPARWWVYLGRVPPGWLGDWKRRPDAVPAEAIGEIAKGAGGGREASHGRVRAHR